MPRSRGLYRTRVAGTPRLRHVPGTTRSDVFPALFRGTVAYNHIVGERGSAVRVRALDGGFPRTVWSNLTDPSRTWVALQIAVGIRGSVAIVTARDGAGNGAYRALLARPGRTTRRLRTLGLGHDHTGGLGVEISPSGRRLRVIREFDASTSTYSYALPSGR